MSDDRWMTDFGRELNRRQSESVNTPHNGTPGRRPGVPWADQVLRGKEMRAPEESPLKQWWLSEQAKKKGGG